MSYSNEELTSDLRALIEASLIDLDERSAGGPTTFTPKADEIAAWTLLNEEPVEESALYTRLTMANEEARVDRERCIAERGSDGNN
jgi:hypothetical protein